MEKIKKSTIITITLAVLLIIAVGYIVVDKYKAVKLQQQQLIYQQGAQKGYEQAILQVAQQAVTCKEVPLMVGNQSINIVAVDCLTQK